ncbi:hypothetical protein AB833_30435 [Chromatiales bacterium (ex Bugula neritina AB1)]|nr:hypothetical protein AB833_30435 [Chromatiales bacterium (ex Bugula neritina AB1)]
MSHDDSSFYKPFVFVLGALVLFTLFIIALANLLSPKADPGSDPLVVQRILQQISPVGQSRVESVRTVVPSVAAPVDEVSAAVVDQDQLVDGTDASMTTTSSVQAAELLPTVETEDSAISVRVRATVAVNCAGCHLTGISNAPRMDDSRAWQVLSEKGIDALTASVIRGKGGMPARAESSLNDDQLRLAVAHLLQTAIGSDNNTMAPIVNAVSVAPLDAGIKEIPLEVVPPDVIDEPVIAASEVPEKVKAQVDSLCAACHLSGIGDAPRYGDKAVWEQRMENGVDGLLASVISGVGAMQPRGGSQLSDEELRWAIEYMLTK